MNYEKQAMENLKMYKEARALAVKFLESIKYKSFDCVKSLFTYGDYSNCEFYITDIDKSDYTVSVYNVFDDETYIVSLGRMLDILKESVFAEEVK